MREPWHEMDARPDRGTSLPGVLGERDSLVAQVLADEHAVHLRVCRKHIRQGVDQAVHAFADLEASEVHDVGDLDKKGRWRGGGGLWRINAGGDDRDRLWIDAPPPADLLREGDGWRDDASTPPRLQLLHL